MKHSYDLTTGTLAKHFKNLAIPAAIGLFFSTMYNVVDVFFAGLIGTDAQAGLAISFQAFFVFITIGFGLGSAMTALVGNAIGRKDEYEAGKVALRAQGLLAFVSFINISAFFAPPTKTYFK